MFATWLEGKNTGLPEGQPCCGLCGTLPDAFAASDGVLFLSLCADFCRAGFCWAEFAAGYAGASAGIAVEILLLFRGEGIDTCTQRIQF